MNCLLAPKSVEKDLLSPAPSDLRAIPSWTAMADDGALNECPLNELAATSKVHTYGSYEYVCLLRCKRLQTADKD